RYPRRADSDHLLSTGWWFHCHTGCSAGPAKSSLRRYGACGATCAWTCGLSQVRGDLPRLPGRPKYGQPSCQVTGERKVVRPMDLRSIIEEPHQLPSGACTMPPWCSGTAPSSLSPGLCAENGVPSVGTGERWPTPLSHQPRWKPMLSLALMATVSQCPSSESARAAGIRPPGASLALML